VGKPYIAADYAIVPNHGITAEHRSARINHYPVLYRWVPFYACQTFVYTQRTQGNALVHFHIITNYTCFANNNPGAMIYVKVLSDLCSRVNIYTS
jgi:hypothetical protein